MKKANILIKISVVTGLLGIIAFGLAWYAEFKGFILGLESLHWYFDAMILMLIAIWTKLGAIYHSGGFSNKA